MLKIKKWECKNCRWEFLQWILLKNNWFCNDCFKSWFKEFHTSTNRDIEVLKSIDLKQWNIIVWIDKWIPEWDSCSMQTRIIFNVPMHTASYLNNKLKKNLNSIKNQTCCIEYKWKYILHEDIINQFKNSLQE